MQHLIGILTLASLLSLALGLLLIQKAQAWGFIDIPEDRKVHTLPTPRTGGLCMLGGSLLTLCLVVGLKWMSLPQFPWQSLVAGSGFTFLGAMDDRFGFHPRQKFMLLLAFSALAAWPWLRMATGPSFGGMFLGPYHIHLPAIVFGFILTLWFMSVPNAVNIEDAINGYMGGFLLILMIASYLKGVDTRIVMGVLVGFLLLNWPHAKHFMGDAGSLGGGFLAAEVLLRSGGFTHPLQVLIWTAPISLDVAMGLLRRRRLGMSPFEADRSTCPHHLLARFNGSHLKATTVLWINIALCVWLSTWPWIAGLYLLGYAVALFFLNSHLLFPIKHTPTQDMSSNTP